MLTSQLRPLLVQSSCAIDVNTNSLVVPEPLATGSYALVL